MNWPRHKEKIVKKIYKLTPRTSDKIKMIEQKN